MEVYWSAGCDGRGPSYGLENTLVTARSFGLASVPGTWYFDDVPMPVDGP